MADVRWQNDALDELLEQAAMDTVDEEVIPLIVQDMQRMAPVLTGNLRDNIEAVPGGFISIDARNEQGENYAAFVEFGTEHMMAQPYVRPAVYRKRG